ncbi:MAG TPA: hypothetical protein VNI79_02020 [Sphingomicrobium sp.]|nr:hypothetical protein [Sphingomicrobium sp.]
MSRSLRFVGGALALWVGIRAVSLGMVPGAEAFALERPANARPGTTAGQSALPPIVTTEFGPIAPVAPVYAIDPAAVPARRYAGYPAYGYASGGGFAPIYATPYPRQMRTEFAGSSRPAQRRELDFDGVGDWSLEPAAARYASITPLDRWPLAQIANSQGVPARASAQSVPAQQPRLDRLSMTAWAMLRSQPTGPVNENGSSLAANGMLGGSQAGARILYRFDPRIALSVRTTAPVGGVTRTAELAGGMRWQPFERIPVALTAERRQSVGRDAGRSAFAIFAEGGVYDRPMFARFNLDAYLQAGIVGVRDRSLFADGSATLTRPLWRSFSGGVGVWGGVQPGLYRIDAGPRLTWRVGRSLRVHADYRQRLAGSAAPGSGPVMTLAGDF